MLTFGALASVCAALEVRKRPTSGKGASLPANFLAFRTNYLVVYALISPPTDSMRFRMWNAFLLAVPLNNTWSCTR